MNPLYAYLSDEVGAAATMGLIGGTADALYPLSSVNDREPATKFLTSTTGTINTIRFDHGSAIRVDAISIHGHNLPAGTNVRGYRAAVSDFSALGQDAPIVIDTHPLDGLPHACFVDLRKHAGYGNSASPNTYRYTGVHVPSLAQKVGFGAICVWATLREDIKNVTYPVKSRRSHPSRVFRTAYKRKKVYGLGVRHQEQPCTFRFNEDDHDAIVALVDSCRGQAFAFFWVRNPTQHEGWLASFTEDDLDTDRIAENNDGGVFDLDFTIEELNLGLSIPTA